MLRGLLPEGMSPLATLLLACTAVTLAMLMLRTRGRVSLPGGLGVGRGRQASCPHLGRAGDPFSRHAEAAEDHRCYVYMQRDRVDLAHQQRFCLSANHHACPFLLVRPAHTGSPAAATRRLLGGLALPARRAWLLAPEVLALLATAGLASGLVARRRLRWVGRAGARGVSTALDGAAAGGARGTRGTRHALARLARWAASAARALLQGTAAAARGLAQAAASMARGLTDATRRSAAALARRARRARASRPTAATAGVHARTAAGVNATSTQAADADGVPTGAPAAWSSASAPVSAMQAAASWGFAPAAITADATPADLTAPPHALPPAPVPAPIPAFAASAAAPASTPALAAASAPAPAPAPAVAAGSVPAARQAVRATAGLASQAFVAASSFGRRGLASLHSVSFWPRLRQPAAAEATAAASAAAEGASAKAAAAARPVVLCHESAHRRSTTELVTATGGPSLLARAAAREADLLERGVAALEAGHEAEAHELFRRAVDLNPKAGRAWFWRAKTAQTLDEVIECLERAAALEPSNEKIRVNLAWARRRREHENLTAALTSTQTGGGAVATKAWPGTGRRRRSLAAALASARAFVLIALRGALRAAAACAAVGVGAAWIAGGLPGDLRQRLLAADTAGLGRALPALDLSPLPTFARIEALDGYNAFAALPFVLGILALLVASGLLGRERWTRLWSPLLGAGSAGLWLGVFGVAASAAPLALCGLVALGGLVAAPDREYA